MGVLLLDPRPYKDLKDSSLGRAPSFHQGFQHRSIMFWVNLLINQPADTGETITPLVERSMKLTNPPEILLE